MKCLVTGAGGFIGSHLTESLIAQGHEVTGTFHSAPPANPKNEAAWQPVSLNVLEREKVFSLIRDFRPDQIFHLAAQSLVMPSWKNPVETFQINVTGTLHLLEAVLAAKIKPRMVIACSSAEYAPSKDGRPLKENDPLNPSSPYGVSKVAQDQMAELYGRAHGLELMRVRPFFIIGPRKRKDVCSDFAKGIAAVEQGRKKNLGVGNMEAVRDFLDIRDAIKAFEAVMGEGTAGEVYNISSGSGRSVQAILDRMIPMASAPIKVESDPSLFRPLDEAVKVGDNTKLRALGWRPGADLEKTLKAILDYWRRQPAPTSSQ